MIPGMAAPHPMHAAQPHGPSPLAAMLQHHASTMGPPNIQMGHATGPVQQPGAPMQIGVGGHPAPRAGHAPNIMPGHPTPAVPMPIGAPC